MNEDLLRGIAAELNDAPEAGQRVARAKALVEGVNSRIALAAFDMLPFDSSPYGFQSWLAAADKI